MTETSYRQQHQPDYDRCGWGTNWGCREHLTPGQDVSIVLNAVEPEDYIDNGHRLFHTLCLPESAAPAFNSRRVPDELVRLGSRRRLRVAAR